MPESPPAKEQTSQPPRTSYKGDVPGTGPDQERSLPRPEIAPQQLPTLPPVASIAGFGTGMPPVPTAIDAGSPASVRPFGVHSMLNPTSDFEPPRQRISQSPGRSINAAYGSHQPSLLSPRIRKRGEESSPSRASQGAPEQRQGRRMLTPKSPALRSMSQTVRGSPSGLRSSRGSIGSGEGRAYTAEPGEPITGTIPPLPPLHRSAQSSFPISLPPQEHLPTNLVISHSNSTASYSANTQGYVGSPSGSSNLAEREETSPFQPPLQESKPFAGISGVRSYGAGQPAYQMQLATDQGPMIVPVEVDIQQASKLADEKRKRNAGASARFRQRRKEKEQAAAATIAELQRQMRELTEDRDFYLGERNALRDFIAHLAGVQPPPRPPSPHVRRAQSTGQYVSGQAEPSPLDYVRREMGEPSPAQRRRTNEYQPSFAAPPLAPANYGSQYSQAQPPSYALPPPSLPAPLPDPRAQPSDPPAAGQHGLHAQTPHPSQPPAGLRPQPYDPFRRDPNAR